MSNIEQIKTPRPSMPPAPQLPLYYEPHPLAALMPMMDEEPFKMFKANIAKEGIKEPMSIYQGLLLDGRNRQRAAVELGLNLTAANFKEFSGTAAEAEAFVISANLHRRQLNNKQKVEFVSRFAPDIRDILKELAANSTG